MMFKFILLFIIITMLLAVSILADDISVRQNQLDNLKNELIVKRAQFDSLSQKEKGENARLRDIEEQAALSSQLLLKIKKESQQVSSNISTRQMLLNDIQVQLAGRKTILAERLRYIYKTSSQPPWMAALVSGNPSDILASYKNMKVLAEYDRHLLQSYNDLSTQMQSGLEKLQRDQTLLSGLQSDQETELKKREQTLQKRKKLINKLKKDKREVQRSIAQIESDAIEIEGIIEGLQQEQQASGAVTGLNGLADARGNLLWPAIGKVTREFGAVTDKRGLTLFNPGIDIQARLNSNVLAAAEGVVMYISWLRGYGQFIILDHGQAYCTLYANLSDILVETGDHVMAGELIGLVGDSGSLEGPKLHFELRHRKEQLNPTEWLR